MYSKPSSHRKILIAVQEVDERLRASRADMEVSVADTFLRGITTMVNHGKPW